VLGELSKVKKTFHYTIAELPFFIYIHELRLNWLIE